MEDNDTVSGADCLMDAQVCVPWTWTSSCGGYLTYLVRFLPAALVDVSRLACEHGPGNTTQREASQEGELLLGNQEPLIDGREAQL